MTEITNADVINAYAQYPQDRIEEYGDEGDLIHQHLLLSTYLNSVIEAGCMLQKVIEPQLEQTTAQAHDAERYWSVPGHIVIFASKFS